MRKAVTKVLGKTVPVIAKGLGNKHFPNGACQVDGVCASEEQLLAVFNDAGGVVDGWIAEGFYGNEVVDSCKNNMNDGVIQLHSPDEWLEAVQSLAWAAQNGFPAFSIIFQAGCKSPIQELHDRKTRDIYEEGGYVSFLLAAEVGGVGGGQRNPVTFGINAMYRDTPTAASYAHLHPRYTWPIGAPTESYPPVDFAKYQMSASSSAVYGRKFANGFVIYTSNNATTVKDVVLVGGPYIDPDLNTTGIQTVTLPPQQGKLFLLH
jgi:hypothetical protein